jgi:alanyl-tRNA synthetase
MEKGFQAGMKSDKQIKKEFKAKASSHPDNYYATGVLKQEGFVRKKCQCGTFFWTVNPEQEVCGDPACSGGFRFIGNTPATKKLDYIGVWNEFARLFKKWGYTPIPRYPVVARWRDDTDFVQASIYDFQPYVVSGEVEPPANPLVVPQICLRFNDIDNIGITGSHYSAFVMIGQHAFLAEKDWSQPKFFSDIHNWLKQGLGISNEEITFHEDAWAGGGNFGPCMEYFSRGLELGNQVYMLYEQTPSGNKPLALKVLDMGMGHERNSWFTQGSATSYETTFPTVVNRLYKETGIKPESAMITKFIPYASYLNVDEVDNIDEAWKGVASRVGVSVKELRSTVEPLAALYSVAEHSRALLVALSDGALPSNVGGGYNLRMLFRRALRFIDHYSWDTDMPSLCEEHARYLKKIFPELSENLEQVSDILEVERDKYKATKEKSKSIVAQIVKEKIDNKKLLQLYDSQGITPDMIEEEAERQGITVKVPDNFYAMVAELHERVEQAHATGKNEKLELAGVPDTKILYYDDYSLTEFKGTVQKVIGRNVVLDSTAFYPTSGGQLHDIGTLGGGRVVDVFKQGAVIVHELESEPEFKEGDKVGGVIDLGRRRQLAQHHTSTHIINAAARKVLGKHINQAGAKKTEEKAHLDVTHYQNISDKEVRKIEDEANSIISRDAEVKSFLLPRGEAEKRYGMAIYQGGAVPGKVIRIIDIDGIDVEACGGTHLNKTSEAGRVHILKATKIQDGIIRLVFTAGGAAAKTVDAKSSAVREAAELLGVEESQVPARAQELFDKWKRARKAVKKKQKLKASELELSSTERYDGDVIAKAAEILRTQPEHVVNSLKKFLKEMERFRAGPNNF